MGNVWSYYDGDVFDKAACLAEEAHACSTFYTSFRRSAAKVVLQQEASGLTSEREEVLLTLENWVSEASVLYDEDDEFPTTISMQQELVYDHTKVGDVTRANANENVPATLEENILKGLTSNPLSTPDSIYKILVQLGKRLGGDEFLRVVGKYPRAARLFASQQLIARSDVGNTFQMNLLHRDFSQAASVVGKAAYGDGVLETKRNRLKEAAKLLKVSLETTSPSITSALSLSAIDLHELSVSRSADSFNQVMTNEMLQLLETQRSMERTLAIPAGLLVGSSLVETIQKLVTLHPVHRQALVLAVDCAEQYTVPPRQFWWTLLRVLVRTDQWETLLALAGVVRPPIGYVPIVEVMLDDNKYELVRDLVEVIQDNDEREQILALLAEDQDEDDDQGEQQFDTL
ncbi:Vacuolar protein sorting-associated protein [Phytophthora megakarya]|uniref:Vacuolar protein sorting-associated protein n=1 Tax=Phytophthora megakarya TaxID=4795 RepID=A0A225WXT0_9STRA|nr:Vacuolar protein sorting-associated protein [Phytophthora megakarya]